jgi:hypothetical protein
MYVHYWDFRYQSASRSKACLAGTGASTKAVIQLI